MKKVFIFLLTIIAFLSCEKDDSHVYVLEKKLPSTEVFIQGAYIGPTQITRSHGYGDRWPHIESDWESARFSIRIDGNIPGYTNQSSTEYWGGFEGPNLGKVYSIYPYGHYDDRGFDYYKVDKATGYNIGLFRYVFDPKGINTVKSLMEVPDMKVVLEYWRDKHRSQKEVNDINAVLEKWDELHILWYVVKEVGSHNLWHVNGVLTSKDIDDINDTTEGDDIQKDVEKYDFEPTITDPLSVPDNVEVDIHLQKHTDWNEIKTSIHIRTDAKDVIVNIPIDYANIVEQDDFAVRFYDYYYHEYSIEHEIIHDENGITIKINNIDPEFINYLKKSFGDGLTIEVHSYCKERTFDKIQQSTVTTTNNCEIKYFISDAIRREN